MEKDTLMSMWNNLGNNTANPETLKTVITARTHPVLKKIRKQLIIETSGFAILLFVYYDFFDGDQKPLYGNAALIIALLLAIFHNVTGYRMTGRSFAIATIRQSLEQTLSGIKKYALLSVVSRITTAICLLIFFSSVIHFTTGKYFLLLAIVIIFSVQIILLQRLWRKRITQITNTLTDLTTGQ